MVSASEQGQAARWVSVGRHWWALAVALCPVSYVAAALVLFSRVAGGLAAVVLVVSLVRVLPRDWRPSLYSRQCWALALLGAAAVGAVAFLVGKVSQGAAVLCGLAVLVEIGFAWAAVSGLRRDLGGGPFDPGACVRGEARPGQACSRTTLAFVLFFSLLVLAAGAMWNRGEVWAPPPAGWVLALLFLTVGAMLVERVTFFEQSARQGNLSLPGHSHRSWLVGALLVLALATVLAAVGPWQARPPQDTSRTGSRTERRPAPVSLPQLQQQVQRLSAAAAAAASAAAHTPPLTIALWLLLLLLLIILITIWLFGRSRLARWVVALFAWLVTRAVKAWQWLRAWLLRPRAPRRPASVPGESAPAWTRDPFFDVFAHPELLSILGRREVILRTYHLLLTLAEVMGQDRRANQTPLEFARALELAPAEASSALGELTWGYVHAMYGGASAELPEPPAIQRAWARVVEALTGHVQPEELALRKHAYLQRQALLARRRA